MRTIFIRKSGVKQVHNKTKLRRITHELLIYFMVVCIAFLPHAEAGSIAKSVRRAAMARLFKQDLKNHAATVARPLTRSRTVHRYTSKARAKHEMTYGLAPNTHMTVRARPGRPLSPINAQRRYGLPYAPQVRETIYLQKGLRVRHNKAVGGAPGVGEITSPRGISASNIRRTIPLQRGK